MLYRGNLFLLTFLTSLVQACWGRDDVTAENMTSLRKYLLRDYDPYLRPRKIQADPLIINASFFVHRFNDINEKEESISLLGYLRISWNDEFLAWNKQEHSNISNIEFKTNDIWWPTIALGNPVGEFETFQNPFKIFRVSSSGDIEWYPAGLYSVVCELNLKKYPFDTQTCDFMFVAIGYSLDDVIINAEHSVLHNRETTEWKVEAGRIYSMAPYGKTGLTASFTLQRKPYFVVLTVLLPLCLLSVMNLFVFLIPVESGEKISFAITTFLAYSIYLSAIGSSLPAKDNVHMVVYIEILMVLSVIMMVLVIVQTRLYFYYGEHHLPCFVGNTISEKIVRTNKGDVKHTPSLETSKPLKRRTWANSMIIIDKVLFISFSCVLGSVSIYYFDLMMAKS